MARCRMHCSSSLILVGLTLAVVSVVPVSVASNDLQQSGRQLLQSEKFQECKAAFDNLGGSEEEVAKKLPACTQTQPVLGDCCSQVKGLLSQAPSDCLCDWDVWNAVQARAGSNAGTLKQFLDVCKISNAGTGNC